MAAPIPNPTAQGAVPAIGIPNSQDTARLVFSAPYFTTVAIAEIIEPSVLEAVEAVLPALVPPYVDQAAQAAVQQTAVLLTGSTMSGPLNLSPLLPVTDSMAATKAYVDMMVATAGVPEVPTVPVGQSWVRQVGQWMPLVDDPAGPFLALSGGSMQGQINMQGNAILNLPAVPVFPNGAAPATWVLNQISATSLYQGTWNLDTMQPDLTQPSRQINGYMFIAVTAAPAGVVVGPAVPGLQGLTVFNGDTVIYSATQGGFSAIHAGGLTAPQADARYVMLTGSQMSGALLLNANASQALQAVTLQQLQAFVPPGVVGEAPADGQLYGRNGVTKAWSAVLPLAGGVLGGALTLSGNASSNLHAVPFQQLNSTLATQLSGYIPLAGGVAMTGLFTLSGNAGSNLNPVPLQQINAMLGTYAPLDNPVFTGNPQAPTQALNDADNSIATTAFVNQGFLKLSGGNLTGNVASTASISAAVLAVTGGIAHALNLYDANTPANYFGLFSLADVLSVFSSVGGTTIYTIDRNGSVVQRGNLTTASGAIAGADAWIEVGGGRAGTGNAYIDLHSTTAPDNDARFLVGPTGSAAISLTSAAGSLGISTGGVERARFGAFPNTVQLVVDGNIQMGPQTANYLYFANGTGSVNATGGTFVYGDISSIALHLGGTAGSGVLIQDSAGTTQITLGVDASISCRKGYVTQGGAFAAPQPHVFNIDWQPNPFLWVDGVNVGQLAIVSDYRVKENVTDLPSTWAQVAALRPVSFTLKENAELLMAKSVEPQWGFIAHELQDTLIKSVATGEKDAPDLIQSPNPLAVLAGVTKALQEAMARIEVLEGGAAPKAAPKPQAEGRAANRR